MADSRYIPAGTVISNASNSYACQPYCVVLAGQPGHWVCVMTWNAENYEEGTPGEHMVSIRTMDYGATWSPLVDVTAYEPATTHLVSAYGSIVSRTDDSRMFAVYIYNYNNVTNLPGEKPRDSFRADMLGEFCWSYSDDQGRSWSARNYAIPVPRTYIESINSWNGSVQIMWEVRCFCAVGKPLTTTTSAAATTTNNTNVTIPPLCFPL